MERHEPSAARDIIQKRLCRFRIDPADVRVQDNGIVALEIFRIQVRNFVRVHKLDTALRKHWRQLDEPLARTVVAVVAKEQDVQVFGVGSLYA